MPQDSTVATTVATPAATLADTLLRQRQAYLAQPTPTLAERQADLQTLARFIQDNKQALLDAISADYGHRSPHETLLTEVGPVLNAIRHPRAHLRRWMRPQRRGIDRLGELIDAGTVVVDRNPERCLPVAEKCFGTFTRNKNAAHIREVNTRKTVGVGHYAMIIRAGRKGRIRCAIGRNCQHTALHGTNEIDGTAKRVGIANFRIGVSRFCIG